jgi:hypothetical protein
MNSCANREMPAPMAASISPWLFIETSGRLPVASRADETPSAAPPLRPHHGPA